MNVYVFYTDKVDEKLKLQFLSKSARNLSLSGISRILNQGCPDFVIVFE